MIEIFTSQEYANNFPQQFHENVCTPRQNNDLLIEIISCKCIDCIFTVTHN